MTSFVDGDREFKKGIGALSKGLQFLFQVTEAGPIPELTFDRSFWTLIPNVVGIGALFGGGPVKKTILAEGHRPAVLNLYTSHPPTCPSLSAILSVVISRSE